MKRILFVDDEAAILDGLRMMLHRRRSEWQMDFADSGAAALALLARQPYDLVCSDMRMPGMDGAQLLTAVAEQWPQTVRIVLSGYSEQAQTMRLVPIAHQYLSKPCEPKQFENVIARCLDVQELLSSDALRGVIGSVRALPALPKTYQKLREAMTHPDIGVNEIAAIVAADTAVAAKVLHVVNSAFFRLARRVTKIEQAVSYLGFASIRNLVLSAEVFSQLPKTRVEGFSAETMQAHSLSVMGAMRVLVQGLPIAEDAVVVGLLHDVGHLVLLQACPEKLQAAVRESAAQKSPLHVVEERLIGASHAAVGAYLLALWGLPYHIVDAVARHHESANPHTDFDLHAALILAERLVEESDTTMAMHELPADDDLVAALHAPFSLNEARQRVHAMQTAGDASQ